METVNSARVACTTSAHDWIMKIIVCVYPYCAQARALRLSV